MLSIPPATKTSASPAMMALAAIITVFSPEPQTLFIAAAPTVSGKPPRKAACLAGACPPPADTTFPMSTSYTVDGSTPARSTAALTALAPRSVTSTELNAPINFPTGVLAAERITASLPSPFPFI